MSGHQDQVRKQYALEARTYSRTVPFRQWEKAVPMIDLAKPTLKDRVLDVACGWGFVAFAFSPLVRSITGVDLTPEMIELAKKLADERGVPNAAFSVGDAQELSFEPGSFDLVTCRAAFDHFDDPEKALRAMTRVLAREGRMVLYEFVAPADLQKAHFYHEIETARDPSHRWSSSIHEFEELFWKCGLEEGGRIINLLKRDFEAWMSGLDAERETKEKVRGLIEDSIQGDKAGLAPRLRGGKLTFTHSCVAWLLSRRSTDG